MTDLMFGSAIETRTMIGMDSHGTGLSYAETLWKYNKYILLPSYDVYYHQGPEDRRVVTNPPYGFWNPSPDNDPYHTGGVWEILAN